MTDPVPLPAREQEIARLVAAGFSDKQVGALVTPTLSQQRVCQIVDRIARRWRLDRARNIRIQIARMVERMSGLAAQ